jgi:hypothetical protein
LGKTDIFDPAIERRAIVDDAHLFQIRISEYAITHVIGSHLIVSIIPYVKAFHTGTYEELHKEIKRKLLILLYKLMEKWTPLFHQVVL